MVPLTLISILFGAHALFSAFEAVQKGVDPVTGFATGFGYLYQPEHTERRAGRVRVCSHRRQATKMKSDSVSSTADTYSYSSVMLLSSA